MRTASSISDSDTKRLAEDAAANGAQAGETGAAADESAGATSDQNGAASVVDGFTEQDGSIAAITEPASGTPAMSLSPEARQAGDACISCGLCLPSCPTYLETGNEADSPRGRIRLMLGLADGSVADTPAGRSHLAQCLDCRACETACPSGVEYHVLIEDARTKLNDADQAAGRKNLPGQLSWLQRRVLFSILTKPNRLRASLVPAKLMQKLGLWGLLDTLKITSLLPPTLRRMKRMLPEDWAGKPEAARLWPRPIPSHSRAGGMDLVVKMLNPSAAEDATKVDLVVGFFEGCVASVMNADVHHKAAELLCACGADVVSPPQQWCCGAIHHHNGDAESAKVMARHNIDTYLPDSDTELDYIVTCVAGDGAMLRQYGELLADDPDYAAKARRFSEKVRDVTEVIAELGLPPMKYAIETGATYHDACHLCHASGVTQEPRDLLASVPGLDLQELPESDVCCGAAGSYNLTQPDMAGDLAERKLAHIEETGCQLIASGNIGCNMHLSTAAKDAGKNLKFRHPVEILHAAVFGTKLG